MVTWISEIIMQGEFNNPINKQVVRKVAILQTIRKSSSLSNKGQSTRLEQQRLYYLDPTFQECIQRKLPRTYMNRKNKTKKYFFSSSTKSQ